MTIALRRQRDDWRDLQRRLAERVSCGLDILKEIVEMVMRRGRGVEGQRRHEARGHVACLRAYEGLGSILRRGLASTAVHGEARRGPWDPYTSQGVEILTVPGQASSSKFCRGFGAEIDENVGVNEGWDRGVVRSDKGATYLRLVFGERLRVLYALKRAGLREKRAKLRVQIQERGRARGGNVGGVGVEPEMSSFTEGVEAERETLAEFLTCAWCTREGAAIEHAMVKAPRVLEFRPRKSSCVGSRAKGNPPGSNTKLGRWGVYCPSWNRYVKMSRGLVALLRLAARSSRLLRSSCAWVERAETSSSSKSRTAVVRVASVKPKRTVLESRSEDKGRKRYGRANAGGLVDGAS
ncbi:hypothetical protein EDB85DRAFT_2215720 [Lactarius pseudohatsudake]|nr:hypothetical protein EDB85DRAFT_2215720 [Lactarius pseudohatsudake]